MKQAFTLTEVLITVAIIGVVAAMTVPNIVSNYQKETLSTNLKKLVNEMTQAVDLAITEEGKSHLGATSIINTSDGVQNFVENHFKYTKSCDDAGCFSANYDAITPQQNLTEPSCSNGKSYLLSSSSVICITKTDVDNVPFLKILVDVNGDEKPNMGGRDMFTFYIDKNAQAIGNLPKSGNADEYEEAPASNCPDSALGEGCFSELVNRNWKMNY